MGDRFAARGVMTSLALLVLLASTVPALDRPGIPTFPPPDRPVASIVSPEYSDEKTRDGHGEAERVMERLGIKPPQRVADIGAGRAGGHHRHGSAHPRPWHPTDAPSLRAGRGRLPAARLRLAGPRRRLSGRFHPAREPAAGRGDPTLPAVGATGSDTTGTIRSETSSRRVCIPVTSRPRPELESERQQSDGPWEGSNGVLSRDGPDERVQPALRSLLPTGHGRGPVELAGCAVGVRGHPGQVDEPRGRRERPPS